MLWIRVIFGKNCTYYCENDGLCASGTPNKPQSQIRVCAWVCDLFNFWHASAHTLQTTLRLREPYKIFANTIGNEIKFTKSWYKWDWLSNCIFYRVKLTRLASSTSMGSHDLWIWIHQLHAIYNKIIQSHRQYITRAAASLRASVQVAKTVLGVNKRPSDGGFQELGVRDLHGAGFCRPGPWTSRPGPARGPELSLGPGPFRPVAWPSPARPDPARPGPVRSGPTKAVSMGFLETIQFN